METGMADYAHKAATTGSIYLATVAEYDSTATMLRDLSVKVSRVSGQHLEKRQRG